LSDLESMQIGVGVANVWLYLFGDRTICNLIFSRFFAVCECRVWSNAAGITGYIRVSGHQVVGRCRRGRRVATQRAVSVAYSGHPRREDRPQRDDVGPAWFCRLRHELRRSARRSFDQVAAYRSVSISRMKIASIHIYSCIHRGDEFKPQEYVYCIVITHPPTSHAAFEFRLSFASKIYTNICSFQKSVCRNF